MFLAYPPALSRESVPEILNSALNSQPDMHVIFVNGSNSNISPSKDVSRIVTQLEEEDQNRVRRIILPGDTHPVGDRSKRIGWLFRKVMKD